MAHLTVEQLLREVAEEAGLPEPPRHVLRRNLEATLSALASELPATDLRSLASSLPDELEPALCNSERRDSFFDHVARSESVLSSEAVCYEDASDDARSCLRALGRVLEPELVERLTEHLPAHVAVHLGRGAEEISAPRPGRAPS